MGKGLRKEWHELQGVWVIGKMNGMKGCKTKLMQSKNGQMGRRLEQTGLQFT